MDDDYVLIDRTKLFIPATVEIVSEFKKLAKTINEQTEKLYTFSVSNEFKQLERTHAENGDVKQFIQLTFVLNDMLQSIHEQLKLLSITGGGFFSKAPKKPEVDMELFLEHLSSKINREHIKFNAIFSNIVQFVLLFNNNEHSKALLFFDNMKTKMASFNVIVNDIKQIIKDYNKMPSKLKNGGKKRRTHRTKNRSRITKRRRF
jgi:hypothetical protein